MLQALMALVTIILMGVVLSEIDKEAERIGATVNEDAKVSLGIYLCRPSVPAANHVPLPCLSIPSYSPYPCPPTIPLPTHHPQPPQGFIIFLFLASTFLLIISGTQLNSYLFELHPRLSC